MFVFLFFLHCAGLSVANLSEILPNYNDPNEISSEYYQNGIIEDKIKYTVNTLFKLRKLYQLHIFCKSEIFASNLKNNWLRTSINQLSN